MKRKVFRNVVIALLVLEIPMLYLTFRSYANRDKDINKVNYKEQENIKTNSTLAYYLDGEPQENRNKWPTDSPDIAYYKAECYDENDSPIESSEVVSFNYEDHTATITTKKTVYCALYFLSTTKPLGALIKNSGSTLETEKELTTRNNSISGNIKDDLRRFVGTYSQVKNNFICFGTDSQQTCKDNKDTYMYRIIGIDTEGRLKIIKATKLVQGSTSTFQWHNSYSSDITWPNSDLYKRLNGKTTNTSSYPNIFIGNEKYNSYMSDTEWTKLIDTPKYYIGDTTSSSNPTVFQNEKSKDLSGEKIGLMYLSDYLYANKGTADTNNWLFIQNGLNRASNTPSGSIPPTNDYEWTMTRYGKHSNGNYYAWDVLNNGSVNNPILDDTYAVRPVFYLSSEITITDGNGDIGTPYIISDAA